LSHLTLIGFGDRQNLTILSQFNFIIKFQVDKPVPSPVVATKSAPAPTASEEVEKVTEKSVLMEVVFAEAAAPETVVEKEAEKDKTVAAEESVAAPADDTAQSSNQLKPRRVAMLDMEGKEKKKEIRRDSKGFERMEDYFSDSEEESVSKDKDASAADDDAATEESMDTSVAEASVAEASVAEVEKTPAEMVTETKEKEAEPEKEKEPVKEVEKPKEVVKPKEAEKPKAPANEPEKIKKKSKVAAAAAAAFEEDEEEEEEGETMEDIANFITTEVPTKDKKSEEADKSAESAASEVAASTTPVRTSRRSAGATAKSGQKASPTDKAGAKKETGKSKEEWVTAIFGGEEDGDKGKAPSPPKTAEKEKPTKKQQESVYDLEPDGVEFEGKKLIFLPSF
jgi:hypothetical protein